METRQGPHPDFPGARWRKSGHSQGSQHEKEFCVEVAAVGEEGYAVRDSKDPQGAVLRFDPRALRSLLDSVRSL
ncbi:DUF397 domain-containing protein [Actinomadura sp. NPDC023710]|uniref:DUF397 domain-containing protein n=1 Tax=Actinomadura sp. NPDC023710 TaxID=3158219 RepID=UPI0033E7A1FC